MVAMNVWPTDGAAGSVATEAKWRSMARSWVPSGVVSGLGLTYNGASITVTAGGCWVDGHYCELTGPQQFQMTASGLLVVRFDPGLNSAEMLWLDGATVVNQNPGGVWEFLLAKQAAGTMTDARALITGAGIAFATKAGLDLAWPAATAPLGATATTLATGSLWELSDRSGSRLWTAPWNLPWGRLIAAASIGQLQGVNAQVDVPGLTVTVASLPNRLVRFECRLASVANTVAGMGASFVLWQNGVQLQTSTLGMPVAGIGATMGCYTDLAITTAAPLVYKAQIGPFGGGAVSIHVPGQYAGSSLISVTDIGPV